MQSVERACLSPGLKTGLQTGQLHRSNSEPGSPGISTPVRLATEDGHSGSYASSLHSSDGTFVSAGVLSNATSASIDDFASAVSIPLRGSGSPSTARSTSPVPFLSTPTSEPLELVDFSQRDAPHHLQHTASSSPFPSSSPPASPSPPLAPTTITHVDPCPPPPLPHTHPALHPVGPPVLLPPPPSANGLAEALPQALESLSLSRRVSTSSSKEEADAWSTWQGHKRHFFILNSAGKPVFSRYGDENALAGFMAIIQAIVSVVQDQGDTLRHIQAGRHLIVFLVRGPLYLVAASCAGESVPALQRQLELLHNQIIFIVTSSLEKVCLRNPAYDVRQLLGGTWGVLHSLIRTFALDPCYLLEAMQVLPMPQHERRPTSESLAEAIKTSTAMYGVIALDSQIIALERARNAPPLHPWDLLLLTNFICSNDNYRYRFGESFSPVCLPHFRASAFLHAYIRYLAPEAGIYLLLLSPSPESFHLLSDSRSVMEQRLEDEGILPALQQRLEVTGGEGRPKLDFIPKHAGGGQVGHTPLWHFILKLPSRKQAICPAFREPVADRLTHKALVRAYARLHASVWGPTTPSAAPRGPIVPHTPSMWGGGGAGAAAAPKPHRVYWQVDNRWTLLAHVDREAELYAVFDPLVDKEQAAKICEQLRRHVLDKSRLGELVLAL